jgi:hypothetical protein
MGQFADSSLLSLRCPGSCFWLSTRVISLRFHLTFFCGNPLRYCSRGLRLGLTQKAATSPPPSRHWLTGIPWRLSHYQPSASVPPGFPLALLLLLLSRQSRNQITKRPTRAMTSMHGRWVYGSTRAPRVPSGASPDAVVRDLRLRRFASFKTRSPKQRRRRCPYSHSPSAPSIPESHRIKVNQATVFSRPPCNNPTHPITDFYQSRRPIMPHQTRSNQNFSLQP